jgi:hypothetical protein
MIARWSGFRPFSVGTHSAYRPRVIEVTTCGVSVAYQDEGRQLMHPHASQEGQWPLWVGNAVHTLTGYALHSDHALGTPASVDRAKRLITVMPTLNTEQVLAAILVSFVYIATGQPLITRDPGDDNLAEIIQFPPR